MKGILSEGADAPCRDLVIGSLMHGVSSMEEKVLAISSSRMGSQSIRLGWEKFSLSTEHILQQTQMYSRAVDLLVIGHVDSETYGAGRQITEAIADTATVPVISMTDDVYAPQSALAVIGAIWEQLGSLNSKRIAISWGFGARHVLPTTAHSLSLLCTSLGADVKVVCPPEFSLQNRVLRDADKRAERSDSSFEVLTDFEGAFSDVDAVFAANWGSLDHVQRPERNAAIAAEYRHWYFTEETLAARCAFISDSPIESELLASPEICARPNNLTPEWFTKRVEGLIASVSYVTRDSCRKSLI